MNRNSFYQWFHGRAWTLGLSVLMLFFNFGLIAGTPNWANRVIRALEFDRAQILNGEIWRLATGNLVHWSPEHFGLDVAVFLIVGLIYEPILRRAYPWLILFSGLSVGVSVFVFQPELMSYRGLSGVDSGQFAAALGIEWLVAIREKRRWLWVAPAAAVFVVKIAFECATGQMFFGTESLGNIGLPVPLAHVAGIIPVLGLSLFAVVACLSERRTRPNPESDVALWQW